MWLIRIQSLTNGEMLAVTYKATTLVRNRMLMLKTMYLMKRTLSGFGTAGKYANHR